MGRPGFNVADGYAANFGGVLHQLAADLSMLWPHDRRLLAQSRRGQCEQNERNQPRQTARSFAIIFCTVHPLHLFLPRAGCTPLSLVYRATISNGNLSVNSFFLNAQVVC